MALFEQQLQEMLTYYRHLVKRYSKIYENAPPGIIINQRHYGKNQLLQSFTENGIRHRNVITRNPALQRALAQKKFAGEALIILRANVRVLEQAVKQIKPFDPDEILQSMTKGYALLPEDYFFDRESLSVDLHLAGEQVVRIRRHGEWGEREYMQSSSKKEKKRMRTSKGELVRSKSEVLIMETLYRYEIPFRYEQVLYIGSDMWSPDFTFEEKNGRPFYWEHLGMMDRSDYADRNYYKLNQYYKAGLVLGQNLLLSFDRNGTIDMKTIEDMIENEVIPRL